MGKPYMRLRDRRKRGSERERSEKRWRALRMMSGEALGGPRWRALARVRQRMPYEYQVTGYYQLVFYAVMTTEGAFTA